jgi:hypothetical protein
VYGSPVSLVAQWEEVESGLDPRWSEVELSLRVDDPERRGRAAALLGPAQPGRAGEAIRFLAVRAGAGIGPEAVRRLLGKIDDEGIAGTLALVSSEQAVLAEETAAPSLAAAWETGLDSLPTDWSDLTFELALVSSNDVDRAAVLLAPLNPIQTGGRPGFRVRAAHTFGYGASAGMVRRCLERLDGEQIRGSVRIRHVLSDTHPVGTQGAVFGVGSRPS